MDTFHSSLKNSITEILKPLFRFDFCTEGTTCFFQLDATPIFMKCYRGFFKIDRYGLVKGIDVNIVPALSVERCELS